MKVVNFSLHILFALLIIFLDKDVVRQVVSYIFLAEYAYFVYIISQEKKENRLFHFFKPSFLILTYSCIYFGFGNFFLREGLSLNTKIIYTYYSVVNYKLINIFFLVCNYLVFLFASRSAKIELKNVNRKSSRILSKSSLIASISLFVLFNIKDLDLSLFGGSGSFSYVPKVVSSIFIIIYLSSNTSKLRYPFYALLLFAFLVGSYNSKREIVFILLLIVYIETLWHPIKLKINFNSMMIVFLTFSLFLVLIAASSISRGYGDYDPKNMTQSIKYIPDYVQSDIFIDAFGENSELTMVYSSALNAADLYINGNQKTLYGETFLKVLFVPIPRSVFKYKPRSMMEIYSPIAGDISASSFYMLTSPVHFYVELLYNFGIFFFPGLLLLVYVADKIYHNSYSNLVNNKVGTSTILGTVFYAIFLQFVRGSGLDLLTVYILISVPFIFFLLFVNKKINI